MDASREPALWAVPTPATGDRQRQVGALLASVALHALLLWTDTRVAFTTSAPQTHGAGGAAWRVQRYTGPTSRAPGAANQSEPGRAHADGTADPTTLRGAAAANVGGSDLGATALGATALGATALGATALGATDLGATRPGAPTDDSHTASAASSSAPDRPDAKAVEAKAVEAKAVEAKVVEAKAVEAKAVEAKAVEAKAVEAKAAKAPPPLQPAPLPVAEPAPLRKTAVMTEPGMTAPPDTTDLIGAFDVDDPSASARRGQRGNASMTGASSSVAQPDAPRLRAVGAPPPNPERTAQDDAPRAAARPPTLEASPSADPDEREATAWVDQRPETAAASTASTMRPASVGAVGSTARVGQPGSAASTPTHALLRSTDGAWTPTLARIVVAPWAAPSASMVGVASADRAASAERAPVAATTAATAASEARRLATPKRARAVASKLPRTRPPTEPAADDAELAEAEATATEALAEPPREPLEDPVERLARIMGWQSAAPSAASDEGVAAVRAIVLPDAFNPDLQGGVKVRATPLGAYLAETDAEIEAEWLSHPVDPARATIARTVTLAFDIARSGRVDALSIQASSGDTDLDLIALAAVPKRLKRIPRTIEAEPLHHVLTLRYLPSTGGVQAP